MFLNSEGRKRNVSMLVDSNLLLELDRNAFSPRGQPMTIYGDPAYALWVRLQRPFGQETSLLL